MNAYEYEHAILIVDDNTTNIQLASSMLEAENFMLGFAKSGEEALERVKKNRYDLILMDVMMPGIDGFETSRRIREMPEYAQVPIIFVTAKNTDVDILEGFYSGGVDYVTKPYRALELKARVNTHLALKSYRDRLEERVKTEIEKRMQNERLLAQQSKLAAMGEMIGHIAHQWKQPLNILSVIVQDVREVLKYGELDEEYAQKFEQDSLKQIQYMSQTIDDFRNFFKPDKKKELFCVKEAVKKALNLVNDAIIFANISVDTQCQECKTSVLGYQNEFAQVVLNIFSNAKDVLLTKKQVRHIKVGITNSNGLIKLSICDNAGGVPQEIMERIFEPYFTTKGDAHGTGLGLYMSKMIIEENMGGKLTVHNEPEGACFEIELAACEEKPDTLL